MDKSKLYNALSASEWERLIQQEGCPRWTISFYKFYKIGNPHLLRDFLFFGLQRIRVLGRIYVANEGINAQLSIPTKEYEKLIKFVNQITFLRKVSMNFAIDHNGNSFYKLTVKVRKKIVADGLLDNQLDLSNTGYYLSPQEFNQFLQDPNSLCVDIRNHYESEIGHFQSAIRPDVDTFRDSLPIIEKKLEPVKKEKQFLLYCTGGIRCEKASVYLKGKGFEKVYQLEGGIINYIRQVKSKGLTNKFLGKNFVFDQRLRETGSEKVISRCHQCGMPCDQHTNCVNQACHLLFIQCQKCKNTYQNTCSDKCKRISQLPLSQQKKLRKNIPAGHRIFKKGRSEHLRFT